LTSTLPTEDGPASPLVDEQEIHNTGRILKSNRNIITISFVFEGNKDDQIICE